MIDAGFGHAERLGDRRHRGVIVATLEDQGGGEVGSFIDKTAARLVAGDGYRRSPLGGRFPGRLHKGGRGFPQAAPVVRAGAPSLSSKAPMCYLPPGRWARRLVGIRQRRRRWEAIMDLSSVRVFADVTRRVAAAFP